MSLESQYPTQFSKALPGSSVSGRTVPTPAIPTPTNTDPQTWVYPPPGATLAPTVVTANFGPVHLHDHMVLQWWPQLVGVEAGLYCVDGKLASASWPIGEANVVLGYPFTFQFTNDAAQWNVTGDQLCHVKFYNSFNGNSVVWRYIAQERADGFKATWGAPYVPSSLPQVPTSPPQRSNDTYKGQGSNGTQGGIHLTVAESAAIGLGAAVFVCLLTLALILLCWYKRRKRRLRPWQQSQPWQQAPRQDSPPPYEPPEQSREDQELQEVQEVEAVPEVPGNLVLAPELSSSRSGARRANASELASWNSRTQRVDRSWRIINAL